MRSSRCVLPITLVLALLSSVAVAQQSDQVIAERVLGPQWRQLSRRAGMIFVGTVVAPSMHSVTDGTVAAGTISMGTIAAETTPGTAPPVRFSFHVDEAIAGVERGQVLTIREWAGALARQRPMRLGERFLIFLYPPSRLGLTSPVGGSLGQVALDASGKNISNDSAPLGNTPERRHISVNISVLQLERAIRGARSE
jgi:hypothetical protein